MISAWLGILLVLLLLAATLAVLRLLGDRCNLHPESSRKAVHIVMGLVSLTFPWIFTQTWPVLLLAGGAIAVLAVLRFDSPWQTRFGKVLHGVGRYSLGEVYFPLAVAILFVLTGHNRLLYIIPLLTLTLADAVAALVGVRYGQVRYATSEGSKSAEGSLAFFLVAFLSAHVPLLLLSTTGRAESLLIALVLGLLVMLFEAVSVGGLDNLFIPLGCYALLQRYLPLKSDDLLIRLGVLALVALLVFVWRRRTTLKESALLAAALVGYMNWALGGWPWLAVSLLLFLTYTWLWPKSPENSLPVHTVRAVASVAAPGLFWLLALLQTDRSDDFFLPFVLSYAAHSVMVGLTQLHYGKPEQTQRRNLLQAVFNTWLVFLPAFFLPVFDTWTCKHYWANAGVTNGVLWAGIAAGVLYGAGLLHLATIAGFGDDEAAYGRWIRRALVALTAAFAGHALWSGIHSSLT